MQKGGGTRSGLLWEVERLLGEVEELPQVLLMENVPAVIGTENIKDFQSWRGFLEDKGYSCYVDILNAKDYGVAQNRERCFMVSILGDYSYQFPQPIPLKKTMADYLEDEVDEKYYINSEKAMNLIKDLVESGRLEKPVSNTVRRGGQRFDRPPRMGCSSGEKMTVDMNYKQIKSKRDVAVTLCARDYKGFGTGFNTMNGVVESEQQN